MPKFELGVVPCTQRTTERPQGEIWDKRLTPPNTEGRWSSEYCTLQIKADSGLPWCISEFCSEIDCPVARRERKEIRPSVAIRLFNSIEIFNRARVKELGLKDPTDT